jgi:hypothetical protein
MTGNKGLQALIEQRQKHCVHPVWHIVITTMKELCQELSEVIDTMIRTVDYIRTHPLKNRLFTELRKGMCEQYLSLLFHCSSCRLSGGKLAWVSNLWEWLCGDCAFWFWGSADNHLYNAKLEAEFLMLLVGCWLRRPDQLSCDSTVKLFLKHPIFEMFSTLNQKFRFQGSHT